MCTSLSLFLAFHLLVNALAVVGGWEGYMGMRVPACTAAPPNITSRPTYMHSMQQRVLSGWAHVH